jgi:hypothetical protein
MTDFTTVVSNTLEEVQMISGDQQTFIYEIQNFDGSPIDLQYATCKIIIFKYGDPNYIFANLAGTVLPNGGSYNQFSVGFAAVGMFGVFQQQVRIIDAHGIEHIPAQGKIVIFPSPIVV